MAKPSIRSGMTDDQIKFLEQCGDEICDMLRETPFEVEGIPTVAILKKNGEYRNKQLLAGQGFFMKSAYLGAKGILIFQLSPEDSQEYELIEVLQTKLDDIFPLAGSALAEISGIEIPNIQEQGIQTGEEYIEMKKVNIRVVEDFDVIANTYIAKRANDKALEEEMTVKEYENNPNYGVF